jgi:hypothetical protein
MELCPAPNVYRSAALRDLDRAFVSGYMRVNHPDLTEPAFFGPLNDSFSELISLELLPRGTVEPQ